MRFTRREALLAAGAAGAAMFSPTLATAQQKATNHSISVFTKPFNSLSYDELADRIAEMGFSGIEAPIRKGGHVEPEEVADKLPQLVEALKKRGLEITVMTSDINDPADPLTEKVLRTAAGLGVKRYRLKYLKYDLSKSISKQLTEWRSQLADLAAMNGELGIRGLYQNHSGNGYLGAALWDLRQVLRKVPRESLAVAYDIRHATVEGGMSWPTTFKMIRPHIDTVYVKDFIWTDEKKPKHVPLGEGRVDPEFFKLLAETQFDGPISLHEEYLDHKKPELVPQHLESIKRDLATLKTWLA